MNSVETLAYFLEEETLRGLLPGWPGGMNLVLCLDDAGKCDLIVHHRDETERVLTRLAREHYEIDSLLSVSPAVDGYPTRKILFSEEQQLLMLVAEAENLDEVAYDYAINYRFACDEGLDPDLVTGGRSVRLDDSDLDEFADEIAALLPAAPVAMPPEPARQAAAASRPPIVVRRSDSAPQPEPQNVADAPEAAPAVRRVEPTFGRKVGVSFGDLRLPKLTASRQVEPAAVTVAAPSVPTSVPPAPPQRQAEPDTREELPFGFESVVGAGNRDCHFVEAEIYGHGGRIRLVLDPSRIHVDDLPIQVERVGHNVDFSRFALPRGLLEDWQPGQAAVFEMTKEQFPTVLSQLYRSQPHAAAVTVTRRGVFVTPMGALAQPVSRIAPQRLALGWLARQVRAAVGATGATALLALTLHGAIDAPAAAIAQPAAGSQPGVSL